MAASLLDFQLMTRKSPIIKKPLRSQQVPATCAMLYEMEERLNHKMDAGFESLRSEIGGVKSEIGGLKSDVSSIKSDVSGLKSDVSSIKSDVGGLKSDVSSIKSDVSGLKSDVSGIKSELHRVALLVEEQNARNRYVMDGYAQIYELLVDRSSK